MILETINSPADLKKLSTKQLKQLAGEIRRELMRTVPVTGGHLAANLGVVELTIALHCALNTPEDKIVWDVGHQTYVHKMLTGRREKMDTMRQFGGLSGFPKPNESEYDSFGTGHSSTAISAALGMATARSLNGEKYKVAAVVGDGSMTGGLAFEGMNNCGQQNIPMMIILNDNEMSISKNVGALSNYFAKIRSSKRYNVTKVVVRKRLAGIPFIGTFLVKLVERIKSAIKAIFIPNVWFEELNIRYIGTVDGHNIKKMIKIFEQAKDFDTPVLIHIKTTKGKGYELIEQHPSEYHSVSENCNIKCVCEKHNGEQYIPTSFSLAFGKKLCEAARLNEDITAITAAMADGTGLTEFAANFPERFFDVGIAEQHAVTFAAGLAIQGKKPFVAIYSSFLQRAYDQIVHDVCIQKLPVVLCIDRAGISGRDGETHNGQFDIAFLQHIPNIALFAPSTIGEFFDVLDYSATASTPVAIRYGKARPHYHSIECKNIFSWNHTILKGNEKAVVFACGPMVNSALEAAELCRANGIEIAVVNMLCIKPIDTNTLEELKHIKLWITAEDGCITGGIGSTISSYAAQNFAGIKVKHIGIPDNFVVHGSIEEIYELCGMTAKKIYNSVAKEV